MKNLNNKVAVITGASAGIGKAISFELAKAGCKVALIARGQEALDKACKELSDAGATAMSVICDLSNADAFRAVIKTVEAELGDVDILINNVGAGTFKPLHQMTEQELDLCLTLPLTPALTAIHALVPKMRKRGYGHVVNLTSPAGIFPLPYMVPYTTGRQAMVGLNNSLYEELRGTGVGVSLICPAQVNTDYFKNNDADMGWYPKISSIFPISEPETVAKKTVNAILNNKKKVVFPALLTVSIVLFEKMPTLSISLFRLLGLWGPEKRLLERDK